jgi:uncharacterized membrane protein
MTDPTPAIPPQTKKIIVASYPSTNGAKLGLDGLKNAGARLGNVALVHRTADGRVEFTETQDWGLGKSAAVGALAAMLLPGIGLIAGALLGGAAAHFIDAGFPDALLKQMGSGIPAGTSLLIALTEESDLAHAERVVADSGGTIIGSGLEADLERAMGKLR